MMIEAFFDPETWTLTYVVYDSKTQDAVVIDPVLDYEPAGSTYGFGSIDRVLAFVHGKKLNVHYVLETHAHADHLTGAQVLKERIPGLRLATGARITEVQKVFKKVFNLKDLETDGRQFDRLLSDGEILEAGSLKIQTLFTPGHTPSCSSYLIEDAVFTGDALFMPDYGTGRCDFPAGSSEDLYESVHGRLYALPDATRVFTGHDYRPNGRPLRFESTIGEEKQKNIQLRESTPKEAFIHFRNERDRTLDAPRLLLPSVQVNIDGGHLPDPEDNGTAYLKIPLRKK